MTNFITDSFRDFGTYHFFYLLFWNYFILSYYSLNTIINPINIFFSVFWYVKIRNFSFLSNLFNLFFLYTLLFNSLANAIFSFLFLHCIYFMKLFLYKLGRFVVITEKSSKIYLIGIISAKVFIAKHWHI